MIFVQDFVRLGMSMSISALPEDFDQGSEVIHSR